MQSSVVREYILKIIINEEAYLQPLFNSSETKHDKKLLDGRHTAIKQMEYY